MNLQILKIIIDKPINNFKTNVNFNITFSYNGIYFVKKSFRSLIIIQHVVILKDEVFKGDKFYGNYSIPDFKFSGKSEDLKEYIQPSNAMIICGNYIFRSSEKIKINYRIHKPF